MIVTRIRKWGKSQGLRLPKPVLKLAGMAVGDKVEIAVGRGRIVVTKARRSRYLLADLVARIPKDDKARETDWGRPVGKEEW